MLRGSGEGSSVCFMENKTGAIGAFDEGFTISLPHYYDWGEVGASCCLHGILRYQGRQNGKRGAERGASEREFAKRAVHAVRPQSAGAR
jgi:hypothetical protein